MKTCIICIAKNEHNYIDEWINWHLNLGFDNIIICDNDWKDNQYISKDERVIVKDYSKYINLQPIAYTQEYNINKDNYDWIAFIDCDEFIILEDKYKTIKDFISDDIFKDADIIRLHWKIFCGGKELDVKDNDYSVMNRFKERYPMEHEKWSKSIIKTSSVILKEGEKIVHSGYFYNKELKAVNTLGEKCLNEWCTADEIPIYKNAWINHYPTKTIGEFIKQKYFRGGANLNNNRYRTLDYFFMYNPYDKELEEYGKKLISKLYVQPKEIKKDIYISLKFDEKTKRFK